MAEQEQTHASFESEFALGSIGRLLEDADMLPEVGAHTTIMLANLSKSNVTSVPGEEDMEKAISLGTRIKFPDDVFTEIEFFQIGFGLHPREAVLLHMVDETLGSYIMFFLVGKWDELERPGTLGPDELKTKCEFLLYLNDLDPGSNLALWHDDVDLFDPPGVVLTAVDFDLLESRAVKYAYRFPVRVIVTILQRYVGRKLRDLGYKIEDRFPKNLRFTK